ncbi:hypothetical protein [Microbacterium sp.]|uniref:hypothetical protein n=1 Tax=Microbacterium sp. TaxID=51671 RepID=UPI00262CA8CA|nr:hypothetical protein [Microbacterium sp.]
MVGTTVCAKHGGKAALANRGTGNGNYKHGRHSKYLNPALRDRYEEARNDPELLAFRNEIAVLDVLLDDALAAIGHDAGAAERLWRKAQKHLLDFEIGVRSKDNRKQQEAFVHLRETISEGLRDAEARVEARKLIQERTTIAQKEIDRLTKMEHMMTAEQAYMLFSAIMAEAGRIISNGDERARFNNAMAKLAGGIAR